MLETGEHELSSETSALEVRVDSYYVDLPHLPAVVVVVLHLCPTERRKAPVDLGQQEAVGIEPGLTLSFVQLLTGPRALFGMSVEGPVVDLQPGLLVSSRPEGAGRDCRLQTLDGERPAHLVQVAPALQAGRLSDRVVVRAWLRDPDVDVATALLGDLPDRGGDKISPQLGLGPPMRVDDVFDRPAPGSAAHLGVPDDPVATRSLGGDEAGEAFPPPLHEVEPLVLSERTVLIGARPHEKPPR